VIRVHDLWKAFGRRQAVAGVSFEAQDGRITGILGPNGAGKTTTLRMLYTLLQPDRGSVEIDGIDAAENPLEVRRRLGVLPDARGLYQRLTARENIEYFGRLQGLNEARLRERTDRWIHELGMESIAGRRTLGFSQGERVKTALARAMVHEPRNVVLDEPGNGLDVMTLRGLRDTLRRLRDDGRCVLLSTHIMQEVAALCEHIVIISEGRVVAAGDADALRERAGEENLEDAFVRIISASALGAAS